MQYIRECVPVAVFAIASSHASRYVSTNVTDEAASSLSPSSGPTDAPSAGTNTHSPRKTNVGAIAGGVVAGVVILAALLLAIFWHRHRSHKQHAVTPFDATTRPNGKASTISADQREPKAVNSGKSYVASEQTHDLGTLEVSAGALSLTTPEVSRLSSDEPPLQLQNSHGELYAARAPRVEPAHPSQETLPADSSKTSPLGNEMQSLRAELAHLRSQQEHGNAATAPSTAATPELMREIAVLRAEMDAMRLQEELSQGSLPSYSPPAQPLHGFFGGGGQGVTQ